MTDALIAGGELGRIYRPCMGGWCEERESCRHYMSEDTRPPVERLCERGKDGSPVEVYRRQP